jgi:hypothetical protein
MTGRYVSRDADPLRDLTDKVEGRISAALSAKRIPEQATSQIVELEATGHRRRFGTETQ